MPNRFTFARKGAIYYVTTATFISFTSEGIVFFAQKLTLYFIGGYVLNIDIGIVNRYYYYVRDKITTTT